MRLVATEAAGGWPDAQVGEVLAALAAAEEDHNDTTHSIAARYPGAPGWTVRGQVPFSSARKWSGNVPRTAATLAVFAVGLQVLVLAARPLTLYRIVLVIAMAGGLALLLAIPLSRRIFALALPPPATAALTPWRRLKARTGTALDQ